VVCAGLALGPLGVTAAATLRPRPADWRGFWRFAAPRAVSGAIDSTSMWTGVIATAVLAGQAQAGVFAAVGRYVLAGQLAMHGIRVAVAPQLSRLLAARRVDDAAAVHHRVTGWVLALSWPVYLLLAAFAPAFLSLFGGGFGGGAAALAVLAVAMLVNVGFGNVQTLLLMSGNSLRHLAATVAGLTVTLLGGALLIPRYGVLGAAVAWSGGIVLENVLAGIAARAVLGRPLTNPALRVTAAVVAAGTMVASGLGLAVAGRTVAGLCVALALLAGSAGALLVSGRARAYLRGIASTLRPGTG
jgi:O-antigen/teichoic acid export membrane protein